MPARDVSPAAAPVRIGVCADAPGGAVPELRARAEFLAASLALPVVRCGEEGDVNVLLALTPERLELRQTAAGAPGPVYLDLRELDASSSAGLSRKQPLARALGLATGVRTAVDATAGLLGDSLLLASMGLRVLAIERSRVLAACAEDVLRAQEHPRFGPIARERLSLRIGDAREALRSLGDADAPDLVYLDPMHPPRRKAALVKKEMRLIRLLVGEDSDSQELFEAAMDVARKRVVVKRPRHVAPLSPRPIAQHAGRAVRYDVYLPAGR